MPKLRNLSGKEVVGILNHFSFEVISQRGSHVKLRRVSSGIKQTLTIPLHEELDRGTLRAIFRQKLISPLKAELRPYFYSD